MTPLNNGGTHKSNNPLVVEGKPVPFNKQLYANSGLRELFGESPEGEAQVADSTGVSNTLGALFNPREPNLAIMHEKPEHRLLLYMKAQGMSNREIAVQSGYSQPWLSQLFRQPWAQRKLVEILNECGVDEVTGLLKSAAADSVITLITLRDDVTTPAAVKRSCADSILDRVLGKPRQSVEVSQVMAASRENVEELDKELEHLRREEARLGGTSIASTNN